MHGAKNNEGESKDYILSYFCSIYFGYKRGQYGNTSHKSCWPGMNIQRESWN
jgi:hypothetical protein